MKMKSLIQKMCILLLFILPSVALFSPQLVTTLVGAIVIYFFLLSLKNQEKIIVHQQPFFWFAVCFLLFSAFHHTSHREAIKLVLFACLVYATFCIDFSKHSPIGHFALEKKALFYGWGVLCSILLINLLMGQPLHDFFKKPPASMYVQGSLFMSVTLWPLLLMISEVKRRWLVPGGILITIFFLSFMHNDAAILAVIMGCFCALVLQGTFCFLKHFTAVIFGSLCTIFTVFTPLLFHMIVRILESLCTDVSYLHRIEIWKSVLGEAFKTSLFGHGMGSYRLLQGGGMIPISVKGTIVQGEQFGLHAHNLPMHIFYEMGYAGLFIMAGFVGSIGYYTCMEKDPFVRFLKVSAFTSAMVVFWVSVGPYQSWWLSTLLFTVFLFRFLKKRKS